MFDDTVVVRSRAIATNVWEKPSSILLILLFRFPFGIFRERKLPHFSSSLTIYIYRIQWILSHTLAELCSQQKIYYGRITLTPLKTLNGVRFTSIVITVLSRPVFGFLLFLVFFSSFRGRGRAKNFLTCDRLWKLDKSARDRLHE